MHVEIKGSELRRKLRSLYIAVRLWEWPMGWHWAGFVPECHAHQHTGLYMLLIHPWLQMSPPCVLSRFILRSPDMRGQHLLMYMYSNHSAVILQFMLLCTHFHFTNNRTGQWNCDIAIKKIFLWMSFMLLFLSIFNVNKRTSSSLII